MTTTTTNPILNPHARHEFVILFDIIEGNPNGNPDLQGMPRIDIFDGHLRVSDVSQKRHIKDTAVLLDPSKKLWITNGSILGAKGDEYLAKYDAEALDDAEDETDIDSDEEKVESPKKTKGKGKDKKVKIDPSAHANAIQDIIVEHWDILMFGGVLPRIQGGKLMGLVQLETARSIHPVDVIDDTIIMSARQKDDAGANQQMGHKYRVRYAMIQGGGSYNGLISKVKGIPVTESDMELFWKSLYSYPEFTKSSNRAGMSMVEVIVFTHESDRCNINSYDLKKSVTLSLKDGITEPSCREDYLIGYDFKDFEQRGVTITRLSEVV
jgi:CRISPR-associated protein Csd2